MKRIFLALPLSPFFQSKVEEFQNAHQELPVRWIQKKDLHLTLIPPWNTSEKELKETEEKLMTLQNQFQSFSIYFKEIAFGPNPSRPRLIWAEGRGFEPLVELKQQLEKLLNFEPEKRPLKLHVTLARFRPEDSRNFPLQKLEHQIDWEEKMHSLCLIQSYLEPKGARYEKLFQIDFKPSAWPNEEKSPVGKIP